MHKQIAYYENKLAYEIDSSDLNKELKSNKDIVALDTRKNHGFEREHIPNAINIPHKEITAQSTAHLNKSKTYVCYCDGIGCNASTKGALKMARLGFKVKELIGGIHWWKRDGYATSRLNPVKENPTNCEC